MKPSLRHLTIALTAGFFCQVAVAQVATVNGKPIPEEHMDLIMAEQKAQGAPDNAQIRAAVRDELIQREILSQAAVKSGIAKKPDVKTQAEIASQAILIRAYLQDFMEKNPVSDADVKKEYDTVKKTFPANEYKLSHILVEDEAQAQKIIDQLRTGSDFAALAKKHSKEATAQSGGELRPRPNGERWMTLDRFAPPFAQAAQSLKKGGITMKPVKTQYGYHVIKVDDIRKTTPPTLEEATPQIKNHLEEMKLAEHLAALRDKAKIE